MSTIIAALITTVGMVAAALIARGRGGSEE
ncbi:hypothetical protein EV284_6422 [Streptomyces sp. BK022]|nr:hypothetical protein EV284_6422 [Streptomyces sp. BK022]